MRKAFYAAALSIAALLPCPASAAPQKVTIGYVPNLAFSQLYLILNQGWDKQEGIELIPVRFPDAAVEMQAFGKGELDVVYTIITSGLVGRSKGMDLDVVAASSASISTLQGHGRLVELAKTMPVAKAIKKLKEELKRPVRILTFYRGSISDTTLRYWLSRQPEMAADDYSINNVAGQFQFTEAVLTADFDAVCLYEPILTIAKDKGLKLEQLLKPEEMLPDAPAAVLGVRGVWAAKNPETVRALVMLQRRATEALRSDTARYVPDLQKYVSAGMLSNEVVKTAAASMAPYYIVDPHGIVAPTGILQHFMAQDKLIDHEVDLKSFINTSFYDSVVAGSKQ